MICLEVQVPLSDNEMITTIRMVPLVGGVVQLFLFCFLPVNPPLTAQTLDEVDAIAHRPSQTLLLRRRAPAHRHQYLIPPSPISLLTHRVG